MTACCGLPPMAAQPPLHMLRYRGADERSGGNWVAPPQLPTSFREGRMDSETPGLEAFALPELDYSETPTGSDRRSFMMRSAMAMAVVALGGRVNPLWAQTPAGPPLGSTPPD